ncbi:MAG: oligosaccharide flippase family protein [Clostridium sp.]|jgi:O-antigen/teichoic acid export membrane protein|nr:oligosaccharide flippase family protein [Clostridium sp.]
MEKEKEQVRSGAVLSYLILIAGNAIALFYTPFMLRCLGQAEYGTYSLVVSVVSYLTLFDLGFSNVIVRYGSQYKGSGDKEREGRLYAGFLRIYAVIGILVWAAGLYLAFHLSLLENTFRPEELETAKLLMVMGVSNIALSFPLSVFRAVVTVNERWLFLKGVELARTLVTPAAVVLLLLAGYRSVALMGVTVAVNIASMLLHLSYVRGKLRLRIRKGSRLEKETSGEMLSYAFLVFLGMVIDRIYWSTDQVILAAVSGPAAVAVYAIGATFPAYFISFSTAISNVLLPRITKIVAEGGSAREQDRRLTALFVKTGRLQFWILSLILSGFWCFGKDFIRLWAGAAYEEAYWIALVIMAPSIVPLTQNVGISILQAKKLLAFRSVMNLAVAALNLAVSVPLAFRWGGIGCAVGTSFGTVVGAGLCMNLYYHRKAGIDLRLYWSSIFRMIPVLLIPLACGILLKEYWRLDSYGRLGLAAGLYMAVFGAAAYGLGMDPYEKGLVTGLWRRVSAARLYGSGSGKHKKLPEGAGKAAEEGQDV